MTVFLGLVYPLAITGISQVVFPGKADGSKVSVDGKVVGSSLIGQEFKGRAYFHSRPSATEYSRQRHLLRQRRPQQRRSAAKRSATTSTPTCSSERPTTPNCADGPQT